MSLTYWVHIHFDCLFQLFFFLPVSILRIKETKSDYFFFIIYLFSFHFLDIWPFHLHLKLEKTSIPS